jgi:hypothetical protein
MHDWIAFRWDTQHPKSAHPKKGEIWIRKDETKNKLTMWHILQHEKYEEHLMKKYRLTYEEAHRRVSYLWP